MRILGTSVLLLALAAILLSGCGTPEEPPAETSGSPDAPAPLDEAIPETRPPTAGPERGGEAKDRFLDGIYQRITELESEVEVFKAKAQARGTEVKAEYDKFRADWDAKLKSIRDKLDNASNVTGSAWQDTRQELDDAVEEIRKLFDEAQKKFK